MADMSLFTDGTQVAVNRGFPNAAADSHGLALNINQIVVKHPASTYYMRVDGDFMREMGIHSADIVIVDRKLEMQSGDVIVATLDGELILRQFKQIGRRGWLVPANNKYKPIEVTADSDFSVWGVVTYTLHNQLQRS